jgi:serine/threonine protein kinase
MKELAADDPRVIGEYRLRAQLGAGGMGRVYLGLSPAGRAVAIKVVHPDLASDTEFLRRFGQEVAAARAVSGIYTAPVVASGLDERPPWLATAFVPGPPLDQVVAENGPLPEQALWPLLGGLVEALQAIHACGVVHRDLKPANVLLATDGPRVIDFGISRAADGTSLTAAGVVFGTPGYMSPEQAEGRGAGPASDVFALGCVVAYAAAGAGPFGTGTAAAILYRVVHGEPVLDGVPPKFREMVAACLAKDPAARPSLRTLSGAISARLDTTGPSAVAFWPSSVIGVIAAYQARLEQETRRPAEFSWATAAYPPTAPSDPGNRPAPQPLSQAPPSPAPSAPAPSAPAPSAAAPSVAAGAGTRWPHPGAGNGVSQGNSVPPSGAQGYSNPQGYPRSQGYPQPQGYGGAQASQPPYAAPRGYLPANGGPADSAGPGSTGYPGGAAYPGGTGYPGGAGYLPNAGPAGYPQPYRMGSPGPVVPLPPSMAAAVRLMYAGALYALVWAIGVIAVAASVIRNHPIVVAGGDQRLAGAVALTVFVSIVDIVLWLVIARGCRRGRSGARVTGTVLFALHTLGVLGLVSSAQAGLGPAKALTLIGWLIGCAAVVCLWQRASSAFFAARRYRT